MTIKYLGESALQRLVFKIKNALAEKSNEGHTHDRVNGYKIVVSNTVPTVNDGSIITIVV